MQRLVLWNKAKPMLHQCLHRTRAARKNIIEVIIISDAVYTGCCAVQQIPDRKLLPRSIYDVLTQISNDFQRSLYLVQCRQTLAVAARCVRCRHGVTNLSRRNKATSASDHRPSAPWVLSSAGKLIRYLHGSYFLPYRASRLLDIFLFCFLSADSFCHLARLFTERSLLHIICRHAPYCWLATSLFWYSAPTQFSKAFLKNDIPHL